MFFRAETGPEGRVDDGRDRFGVGRGPQLIFAALAGSFVMPRKVTFDNWSSEVTGLVSGSPGDL